MKDLDLLSRDVVVLLTVLGQSSIFNEAHVAGLLCLLRYKTRWSKYSTSELTNMIESLHNTVWTFWKFEISSNGMIRIS
jgi:hypothetical protein